jgi:GNAT superfamily N-acetyltransferase
MSGPAARGVRTRDARAADAPAIAMLAAQLGYPVTAAQITARMRRQEAMTDRRVIVAEDEAGTVLGWTTVRVEEHIHNDPYVEISGFVVEEKARGRGVGRRIMTEVERWTRLQGLTVIRLHANVVRKEAHQFYGALGFAKMKEQFVFRKTLEG